MSVRIFISDHFNKSCDEDKIKLLASQFREYKTTGVPPPTFGRDTTYDFPQQVKEAGMYHIHIKDKTSTNWHLKKIVFHQTSNTALIYCQGSKNKNCYFLLGFIERAHETYLENPLYLLELADIAERFRNKF